MRAPQHLRPSKREAVRASPQPRERRFRDERLLIFGCGVFAAFSLFYNILSPDIFGDELSYTLAARNVAVAGHLTWTNVPVLTHPPLYFVLQAGWLMLTGHDHGPLLGALEAARLSPAAAAAACVLLMAGLAYRLAPYARLRRRQWLTVLVAAIAALDPVLVRYGRQVEIEPVALAASLVVLHSAWSLRNRKFEYVWVVGVLTGLTLLTNEITVFIVTTPVVFALLQRDRALFRRSLAAFAVGLGFMSVWFLWAVEIGIGGTFIAYNTVSLERLVGLVQITGYNAPGYSLGAAVLRSVGQYLGSYIVLAFGGVALCWLWLRRGSAESRFLTAWLTLSYVLGCYIAAVGTFNEEFLVYVIPAAIVSVILVGEAVVTELSRARVTRSGPRARPRRAAGRKVAAVAVAGLLSATGISWIVDYTGRGDGVARLDSFLARRLPACSVVNATGDVEKYSYLLPGRQFSFFSVGPAALADGVHDFLLSPVDAVTNNGNMSPAFAAWIRSNGREIVSFPSDVYGSVELWQVGSVPFDAQADTVDIPGGAFINTTGSRCGGFTVTNSPGSPLYRIFTATGGKSVLGPPRSMAFRTGSVTTEQVFDGGVLVAPRPGSSTPQPAMLPVVADLAIRAPARYAAAHLPPILVAVPAAIRTAWLTDPIIRRAYLGSSRLSAASIARGRRKFGAPLGPPHRVGDNVVAQPFAGTVLEHTLGSDDVHSADIASLLESSGIVVVPRAARRQLSPPALPPSIPLTTAQPTTVVPFLLTLGGALGGYAVIVFVLWRRRRPSGLPVRWGTAG
jgi:hypothetical protein